MACARALVLINYQRAGIAATSAYYLEANTGPEAPLRPAFPSTRSGFINRADHDHDDIKLFCLSSENALSTGVLDTSFICCSASSYFCPLRPPLHSSSQLPPLLQHARFSLSPLFLQPILGRDFRRWQNAGTGKQPIGSPREKGTWMGGRGRDRMTRAVLLSDTSKRSRDPPLSAPDKLLIPESWPLSPLNPDKERYLAPSGTKGAVEVVSTTATDPLSPRLLPTFAILVFFLPSCLYSCPPLPAHQLDFSSFFSLFVAGVPLDTKKRFLPLSSLFFLFPFFPPSPPPVPFDRDDEIAFIHRDLY